MSALYLNKQGFTVFAGCLFPDGPDAQKLKNLSANPNKMHVIKLDVTRDDDIENVFIEVNKIISQNGLQLWSVVNNAGILRLGEVEWGSFEYNFESIIRVNTFGYVKIVRKFLPLIRQSRGRIINVNSTAARFSVPGLVPYCMSKFASLAFTDGLRREMFKFGVKVISVEPFIYSTQIASSGNLTQSQDTCWGQSDSSVKQDYGTRYYKRSLKGQINALGASNGNPHEVVSAVYDGITSSEPNYRYNCCNIVIRFILFIGQLVPIEIIEHLHLIGLKRLKRNRPCPEN